ncbi:hypothetical protein FCV25MIE_33711 [Fagus crenata]
MAAINTLDIAEEKFGAGKVKEALKLANLVKNLSNCPNVDKYRAAYKVHLAHNDLAVLGLKDDTNYSTDKITEKYLKLVQLLHPNVNSSCAAPSAFQRVTRAWEILTDAPRGGMRLLPPSKRNKAR